MTAARPHSRALLQIGGFLLRSSFCALQMYFSLRPLQQVYTQIVNNIIQEIIVFVPLKLIFT